MTAHRKLQKAIAAFVKPTYFPSIPVTELAEIVAAHGFDATDFEGIYTGREGRASIDIGPKHAVQLSWYKMPSGNYEIIAYV